MNRRRSLSWSRSRKTSPVESLSLWERLGEGERIADVTHKQPPSNRRGFTLLEVLLSLIIGGVIMIAIGAALYQQVQSVENSRAGVQQAQLARALLRLMADDLRSGVRYEPLDVESLTEGLGGVASLGDVSLSGAELQALQDAGLGDELNSSGNSLESDEPLDVSGNVEPPPIPGLYGTATELQVDTSRLPRLDQYQQMLALQAAGEPVDPISDVKTVAYYVLGQAPSTTASTTSTNNQTASALDADGNLQTGLVRRQMDRAVTQFAAIEGNLDVLDRGARLIAPEAVAVFFDYFDGTEWVAEWNSDERGGIPLAVKITLILASPGSDADATTFSSGGAVSQGASSISGAAMSSESEWVTYQTIVQLPAAEATSLDDAEETDAEASP